MELSMSELRKNLKDQEQNESAVVIFLVHYLNEFTKYN